MSRRIIEAAYRACRRRCHRHIAEGSLGSHGAPSGRTGPTRTADHAGTIPDNPLRYVLVHALELRGGGLALVDAGWNTDELEARMFDFLADSGVPEDRLPDLSFAPMAMKSMVTMAGADVAFEVARDIELPGWSLRTIWTPGRSPGHVCFFSEEHTLVISGDHVLPGITPNISVHIQQFSNPLGDFLGSLLKVQNLGTEEVLPAHEYRFSDLQSRLEGIITHHADHLEEIEQVLTGQPGSTAW